uniref:Uncharacterized protein n=1 Tax=Auxenochlorella protothecoides TaxID=3075 RepID=A0A1D1ZPK8_AUXPR
MAMTRFSRVDDARTGEGYITRLMPSNDDDSAYDLIITNGTKTFTAQCLNKGAITSVHPACLDHVVAAFSRRPESNDADSGPSRPTYAVELRPGKRTGTQEMRVFLRWSDPSEAEGTMYSLNFGVEESPASEGSMLFTLLSELLEAGQQSAAALASMTAQHTELETRCMRVQRQLVAYADSDAQHRADTAVKVAALLNLHKARERELQAELDCLKQHAAHASLGTAGPSRGPAEAPAPMAEGVETSSGGGSMQGEERADEEEMSGVAASDTDHER